MNARMERERMALENNWGEVGGKGAGAAGREGWPGGGGTVL